MVPGSQFAPTRRTDSLKAAEILDFLQAEGCEPESSSCAVSAAGARRNLSPKDESRAAGGGSPPSASSASSPTPCSGMIEPGAAGGLGNHGCSGLRLSGFL